MKNGMIWMLIIFMTITVCPGEIRANADALSTEKLGDVDQSGEIDAEDALLVLKHAAKLIDLGDLKNLADTEKDGVITAGDALLILKYAAGRYETFSSMALLEKEDKVPEDKVPSVYTEKNTEASGSVITITYDTYDYLGDQSQISKDAYVYLPAGYDETKQYNVMYLMHGVGGTKDEWEIAGENSTLKNYFDNLIAFGDIEPMIVVFPTGRSCANYNDTSKSGMNQNMAAFYLFGQELRNDLIPFIDQQFATYAEYSPGYDLTLARDHRAMAGFSMGGMQTINIGMCECLDIISYFGAFSAAPTTYYADRINKAVSTFGEYDIKLFYNICGYNDTIAWDSHWNAVDGLVEGSGKRLVENKNFIWQEVSGTHTMRVWLKGIYNFAKMAFS